MVPPSAAARSRMPASPLPPPPASAPVAGPSSSIRSRRTPSAYAKRTRACREPEWRTTLVRASCTMRKAARSAPGGNRGGSPSVSTVRPAAAACSTSSGSRSRPGAGARGAAPGARRVPRTWRTSPSASLLADLMVVSAARACSGSLSSSASPMLAWTLMTEMLCARTSCSSRAMRSRSSSARRRAASARSARSRAHCSRRTRASSARATTASTQVATTISWPTPAPRSPAGGSHRYSQSATRTCPAHSTATAAQAARRCPATTAPKQPTATVRKTGPYG